MRHARKPGRHRKPSNAGLLATAGAVGVGTLAAVIISPAAASAATNVQWERVAHCESGDRWHIDTGNGYYGGLQFSASTWASFDVDHYASRADLASKHQQMDVANHVLKRQGWHAWPICSQYAGSPGPSPVETKAGHAKHDGKWIHYRVRHGDTLAEIARRHHVKGGWRTVYRDNRHVIGSNPSAIHAGEKLKLRAHHAH
ncbi:MAG TPA: transglycosylase family protein [Mycobacteriales bacterium]|nr:transglycosylase family protein [Mycobacteriales bacterium]